MNLLEKVEAALESCVNNGKKETELTLSFAELRLIRRYEMVDNYDKDLAHENLKAGKELKENLVEIRNENINGNRKIVHLENWE